MDKQKDSYRTAMKGIAIFGGVQFVLAIINIVRAKFVAILIGTEGMGIAALLNSSIGLINQIASLGVSYSCVRDFARAEVDRDVVRLAKIFVIINRLLWITGSIGAILTIIFAKQLSLWAFEDENYTWSFVWLSIAVLFTIVAQGMNALLQGMRMLKSLAKSSVIGGIVGLLVNVPLYYFYGIDGIVPAIIIAAFTTFILAFYYVRRIETQPQSVSLKETLVHSCRVVKLGVALVFTGLISTLVAYLMNIFLQSTDGKTAVGLYQSGLVLTTQYVGLIFTAMATDYFPRLSMVQEDNAQTNLLVNQQIQMGQLIITPIAIGLIIFAQLAVYLLLSSDFYPTIPLIQLSLAGMLFKTASWAITYIILAKGNTGLYLITEFTYNALWLILNIIGYKLWGLAGIGVAFLMCFFICVIILLIITHTKYGFFFNKKTVQLFWIQQVLLMIGLFVVFGIENEYIRYSAGVVLVIISILYSFWQLDKMLSLWNLIKIKLGRRK